MKYLFKVLSILGLTVHLNIFSSNIMSPRIWIIYLTISIAVCIIADKIWENK